MSYLPPSSKSTASTEYSEAANRSSSHPSNDNPSVPDIPYFTPRHAVSPGTAISKNPPTLFTPLSIRSVTLKNRIVVSPMCQYSTAPSGPQIGQLTPYHIATLGHYAIKGAALTFIEATGVQPSGRITPNCPGLWCDEQIAPVKQVADFVHSQGGLVGIQLAHAGRKGSTVAPWIATAHENKKIVIGDDGATSSKTRSSMRATPNVGGWTPVGPSDRSMHPANKSQAWDGRDDSDADGGYYEPHALTEQEIGNLVQDWADSARRAVQAGVDVIEIHAAHGYLNTEFLSPVTNLRKDKYGGSFENRTRLLRETIAAVRNVMPDSMPLFLRMSATEWLEGSEVERQAGDSWKVEDTLKVAVQLEGWGVDLLDVSSGGNHPAQRKDVFADKTYQTAIAGQIRSEIKKNNGKLLVGAVGLVTDAEQARNLVQLTAQQEAEVVKGMTERGVEEPMADLVFVARQFMREPEWVLRVAHHLGVDVTWPTQFMRVRFPKL